MYSDFLLLCNTYLRFDKRYGDNDIEYTKYISTTNTFIQLSIDSQHYHIATLFLDIDYEIVLSDDSVLFCTKDSTLVFRFDRIGRIFYKHNSSTLNVTIELNF